MGAHILPNSAGVHAKTAERASIANLLRIEIRKSALASRFSGVVYAGGVVTALVATRWIAGAVVVS